MLTRVGWRWLLAVSSLPLLCLALLFPILPESPYCWLPWVGPRRLKMLWGMLHRRTRRQCQGSSPNQAAQGWLSSAASERVGSAMLVTPCFSANQCLRLSAAQCLCLPSISTKTTSHFEGWWSTHLLQFTRWFLHECIVLLPIPGLSATDRHGGARDNLKLKAHLSYNLASLNCSMRAAELLKNISLRRFFDNRLAVSDKFLPWTWIRFLALGLPAG